MSFKHGVILWVSATLTACVIVLIFLTIFRAELNASRRLFKRSSVTFERTEALLQEALDLSTRTKKLVERNEFLSEQVDELYDKLSSENGGNYRAVMKQFEIIQGRLNQINEKLNREQVAYDRLGKQVDDN